MNGPGHKRQAAPLCLLRRCWELTSDEELQRELIAYNIEDCRATAAVADALARICGTSESGGETKLETVNVSSLEVGFQRTFGKFPSALPEFEKINAAAYWDYQRSKVYVRTNKAIRRTIERSVETQSRKWPWKRRLSSMINPRAVPDVAHRSCGLAERMSQHRFRSEVYAPWNQAMDRPVPIQHVTGAAPARQK